MLVGIVSVGVGSLNVFADAPSEYYEGYQGTMSTRVFDGYDSGGSHYHETMLQYDWIDIATVDRVNFTIHSYRRRTDKSFKINSLEYAFYKGNGFDGSKTSVSTSILSVKDYSPVRKSFSGGSDNYATDIYWQKYFDVSKITSLNGVETYRLETKLERYYSVTNSKYATSVNVFYVYCSHTGQLAPTATEPGIMNTECSRCGATSTREIPKLDVVFEIADGSSAVIYEATGYLCGIHERYSDAPTIESYFNMVGCTLEYTSLGTGSTITAKAGDNVIKEMTLIIYGDVTGDGIVDGFDVSSVAAVSCYEYEYEEEYFNEAGDVYDDGYVDVIDLAFIISAANCDITIDQRGN